MTFIRTAALLISVALAGCATRGAHYVPLVDMQGKDPVRYAGDLSDCQGYAAQTADAADRAIVGAIAGALLGAFLAPSGYRGYVGGRVAGIGALSGAAKATDTQETIVKRCMTGRGYYVLM